MAKAAPKVIGVLTAPAPPPRWGANRHKVLLVLGLAVGFYLGTHNASTDAASREDQPRPAHTAPDTRPTTPEGTRP
ncbi:hypothetical protein [Streptomyces durocortorensis]|uniref:Secreted protein n=1 Tax=Streptomyces durocortorensis TaxID=2811104 RepID=A0ABS2I790_9ACTN|nr:hypothetical protein [Streptomyces durocortorensis]MBM7059019.1 hypothetical protein [Streptomyces durocortorensis]